MCSGGMKVHGEEWVASPELGVIGLGVGQAWVGSAPPRSRLPVRFASIVSLVVAVKSDLASTRLV